MSFIHPKSEFVLEENKVYLIRPIDSSNPPKSIHITGTGTVDLRGCIETPTSLNDPILTLDSDDSDLFGFYTMSEINYIKLVPNQAGTRKIILSGFKQPEIIFE